MDKASILTNFPGLAAARTPQDVAVFFDDFLGQSWNEGTGTAEAGPWLYTNVGGGAVLTGAAGTDDAEDEAGGLLSVVTVASADDGANLQVSGTSFHMADDYPLYFETRLNVSDVSNADMFIGLAVADTAIVGDAVTDRVGFELVEGVLSAISENTNVQKTVGTDITETDDDWIRLAFLWDGDDKLTFWVDTDDDGCFDKEVTTLLASTTAHYVVQDMMMTPTIEVITGTTASAATLLVDYVLCAQQRFHE